MTYEKLTAAKWTTRYINDLPDSAFLYIAPGGKKDEQGKTVPRSLRYFPYKDKNGNIDLPHLRNAIQRIPQSRAPGLTVEKKRQLQEKARRILEQENKRRASKSAGQAGLAGRQVELLCAVDDLKITAGAGDGEVLPTFSMVAYTGGQMTVRNWPNPVVVDLSGLSISARSRPVLLGHDPRQIVGHTTRIEVVDTKIIVEGVISGTGEAAKEVVASAQNGFPWRASIGTTVSQAEFIEEDQKVEINGRKFSGPLYAIRQAVLGEVSFVSLAADDDTHVEVAAELSGDEEIEMEDKKDKEKEIEQVERDASTEQDAPTGLPAAGKQAGTVNDGEQPTALPTPALPAGRSGLQAGEAAAVPAQFDVVQRMRQEAAAEAERIASIRKVFAGRFPDLEARAIREDWSLEKCELEIMRASRPTLPAIHSADAESGPRILEAACLMAGGIKPDRLIKTCGEQVVEAAEKQYRHGIGLQQLLLEAAWANGYHGRSFRQDIPAVLHAAFSTVDISNILANVANKFLLEGFSSVESTWRTIATIRPVRDFKQTTSYRMTAGGEFEEVAPDGELKSGTLSDEKFTNQAKTYGYLLTLTRQDMINDDLGALTNIPRMVGRKGALKLNKQFWATFLKNSSFFTVAHGNYATGSTTALSVDALTDAEVLFLKQTDSAGDPIGIQPRFLLVPPALNNTALQLMKSLTLNETTTANKPKPVNNPHVGKYEVAMSRYLSNANLTGYSAKAWYLLADPNDLPVIEVVFLNGKDTPTVEQAEADFNVLGVRFRGYFDFGVALQDYRGGVKMKGEA